MKTPSNLDRIKGLPEENPEEIRYYENEIPEYVSGAIDSCYGALYSSISYLKLTGQLSASTSTYVSLISGNVKSVFLFERNARTIRVLNAAIRTETKEVLRFADFVFEKMPEVIRIYFSGVHMDRLHGKYPIQRYLAGEDIVIPLGKTSDEYRKQIGRSTRQNINRHAAALKLTHPDFVYKAVPGNAADMAVVNRIVAWNRDRMARKSKTSAFKDDDAERFKIMAAASGLIGTLMIGEDICAATVCCRVGMTYYMIMTGHDSLYDEFGVGILCRFWTALECLRMQAKEINLMGGRLSYKYKLLGESRKYESLTIYRDYTAVLRNFKDAFLTALRGTWMEAKFALLDCERKSGSLARLTTRALGIWRTVKRRTRPT
jgi:predicted secreted protein